MNGPLFPEHARTADGLNYGSGTVDIQGATEPAVDSILAIDSEDSAQLKRASFRTIADLGLATISYVDAEIAGIDFSSTVILEPQTTDRNTIVPGGAAVSGLTIKEGAAMTGTSQAFRIKDSSNVVNTSITPDGAIVAKTISLSTASVAVTATGTTGGVRGISSSGYGVKGESDSGMSGYFVSGDAANTEPTIAARRFSTSTADLIVAENTSGTALGGFDYLGRVFAANLATNTYSPTISASTNTDIAVTASEANYMRLTDSVVVSGQFTADPTTTATATSFEMSLPYGTALSSAYRLAGTAFCGSIAGQGAQIIGVVANNTAKVQWIAGDVASQTWSYVYMYRSG